MMADDGIVKDEQDRCVRVYLEGEVIEFVGKERESREIMEEDAVVYSVLTQAMEITSYL